MKALGTAWGIPSSVLAITVLAWGNSIGDTISDIVVAREGYPAMAVGACLGGPLMNLLIGLGIALTFNPMQLRTGCLCFFITSLLTFKVTHYPQMQMFQFHFYF